MAASRSASAKMIFGFFPPSSRETFLNRGAHVSATLRPVTVPPVNEMVLIFGCAVIAAPRSEEHTSELQSQSNIVCRLLLEKKKQTRRVPRDRGTNRLHEVNVLQ